MMAWCGLGVVGQAVGLPAWLAATKPVAPGGMLDLVPAFDWQKVVVAPWTVDIGLYGWMMLMAFLVTTACGLIGNYLLLRRLALVGDAISHSVLPGLVAGFLIFGSLGIGPMLVGAVLAGVLTTVVIELIHSHSRVKADAAIGITFCSLFALGVLLINVYAGQVHLDAECVLYGELSHVPWAEQVTVLGVGVPLPVVVMGVATGIVALLTGLFYKELLISSFDAGLAAAFGFRPRVIHYTLMAMLSLVFSFFVGVQEGANSKGHPRHAAGGHAAAHAGGRGVAAVPDGLQGMQHRIEQLGAEEGPLVRRLWRRWESVNQLVRPLYDLLQPVTRHLPLPARDFLNGGGWLLVIPGVIALLRSWPSLRPRRGQSVSAAADAKTPIF